MTGRHLSAGVADTFRRFQLPHFRLIKEQLRYRNTDRPHARRNVFKRNLIGNIFLVYIFIRFGGLSREEALKPRILFTLPTLYQGEIFVRGFVFGVKKKGSRFSRHAVANWLTPQPSSQAHRVLRLVLGPMCVYSSFICI